MARNLQPSQSDVNAEDDDMGRAMRYALVALMLATIGVAATPAGGPELEGMYIAQGTNPDGSDYQGFVQIARRGESLLVTWIFPQASGEVVVFRLASTGVGILSSGMLAVSYYSTQAAGVVVYHIEEDGKRLAGRWTVAGDDGAVHIETLTRLPGHASQPAEADPPRDEAPKRRAPAHSPKSRSL
jgi:hypothetical protein